VAQEDADDHDAQMRAEWVEACEDWDEWDKPGPMFRVFANTWYVGTCGISAIMIAGSEGHVLIDSGTQNGVRAVAANLEDLGVSPQEIMVLLASHEHHDHVGGMAWLQEHTGAQLVATAMAAPALASGAPLEGDPQAAIFEAFPGARVDDVLDAELAVLHGNLAIRAIPSPGHTPGATSYQWQSCDDSRCLTVAYLDSLSSVSSDDYRFSDHPDYVETFRDSLARVAELDCDILLTPHPSASQMRDKLLAGDLTQGMTCREYAEIMDTRLTERLAREAAQ
jgi:metallo-beta-lactamase class B